MEIFIGIAICILVGWLIPSPLSWFARRKLTEENNSLRQHLHTKMEVDAEGNRKLREDIDELKTQNENLRVTVQTLRNKPGRAEIRLLHVYDKAINDMITRSPGFGSAWQMVLDEAEKEIAQADTGIKAFVKKVFRPSGILGGSAEKSVQLISKNDTETN